MKNKTKLAFDRLEEEMEVISEEEQENYVGGNGHMYSDMHGIVEYVGENGVVSTGVYHTSGIYIGTAMSSTGSSGSSGNSGSSGSSGSSGNSGSSGGSDDPITYYGGYLPTVVVSADATSSEVENAEDAMITAWDGFLTSVGTTANMVDAAKEAGDGRYATWGIDVGKNLLKDAGTVVGVFDAASNFQEAFGEDQLGSYEMWEDLGQVALGITCIATGGTAGLVLGVGLTAWELYEEYGEGN